jgi:hypothetical protein
LPGSIFDKYPFLLPNLVCTVFVVVGVLIGFFFLEETHVDKKDRRDVGLEMGRWMLEKLSWAQDKSIKFSEDDESASFIPKEKPRESSEDVEAGGPVEREIELPDALALHPIKAYSWRETFSAQVRLNILALGVLAL